MCYISSYPAEYMPPVAGFSKKLPILVREEGNDPRIEFDHKNNHYDSS